ncbi:MAG: hypothetical protein RIR10_236, partial [Planctomycetota bacterium]
MHTNDCPQTRSLLSLSVGGWVRTLVASAVIVAVPSTFAQDTAAGTTKSTDSAPERAPGTSTANATTTPSAPAENVPADNVPASTDRPQIHKAIGAADPLVQSFNEHLTILASPWMEGRLPGTRGMERAMEYMEDQFRQAGLEPAYQPAEGGSKTYRQPFSLGGKREVVEERIMALCGGGEIAFTAGTDFKLTSLGKSGSTEGEIAFVGYGIEDGPEGYSSFAEGHSLEGKIALVFRFEPMNEKGKSLWSEGEGWSGRAGFAGKIGAVAKRKPAAIIVVNTPGADDPRIDSLTTAGGGRAMADAPVFMMSTAAAEKLVSACDGKRSLMDLRKLADNPPADQPKSFDLTGSKVSIAGL